MSSPTNEQYERIARYLDGEAVSLTPEEAVVARDLQEAENALADVLPAPVEAGLNQRVWQRVERKNRSAWRRLPLALCGAAAAAAIAVAFMTPQWSGAPQAPGTGGAVLSSLTVQPKPMTVQQTPMFVPRADTKVVVKADVKVDDDDRVAAIGKELDHELRDLETNAVLSRMPAILADGVDSPAEPSNIRSAPKADPTRS